MLLPVILYELLSSSPLSAQASVFLALNVICAHEFL